MELIQQLHSILRWALLIVLLYTIFKAFMGMQQKTSFTNADAKSSLVLMILTDTQLVLGFILYFMGSMGFKNIENMGGNLNAYTSR